MKRNLYWKTVFIVAVVAICLASLIGIPRGLSWTAIKASVASRIHLGLDLQGGTHLILQVHVDDAVNAETDQALGRLQAELAGHNLGSVTLVKPDPKAHPELIEAHGVPAAQAGDFRSVAEDKLGTQYQVASHVGDPASFDISLRPTALTEIRNHALQQSIETITNRVNALGVTEPTVQQHGLGDYQILVQLPGIADPDRVKQVIQQTALLQIRLVKGGPFPSEATALAQFGGVLPEDSVLLPGRNIGGTQSGGETQWYLVSRTAAVSGNDLRDANPSTGTNGGNQVNFVLTGAAGRTFGDFTEQNIGKDLAVVLDNRVQEAAVIKGRIEDQGMIEGSFTPQQASDLALMLRSGALPASISYSEEEVVGPSLGADSIHDGVVASLTGFLVVALFMLVYYRGAGVNAVLALVLNLLVLLAFMATAGATLTLPGIAGIILTIGMAVDSNVLIFERIREEMRAGKSVPAALENGFQKAFVTIVDTHVTTVVSAIFLFLFGTGPIRGFAVTLTVGLLANLFTAVFVSRVIFDYLLSRAPRNAVLSI
ncbi:MAG: protein translocase subunit SecD [Terriglobales bacterium]